MCVVCAQNDVKNSNLPHFKQNNLKISAKNNGKFIDKRKLSDEQEENEHQHDDVLMNIYWVGIKWRKKMYGISQN